MAKSEFELIIREGKRPWWKLALSTIFFTLLLYYLYDNILSVYFFPTEGTGIRVARSLYDMVFLFGMGVVNAMETDILIDTDQDLLITRYRVGPIAVSRRNSVPKLEYVSVFAAQPEVFEVNLWYEGNRHFKMYKFDDRKQAFELAHKVAARLDIDILDATVRGQSKWIEKSPAHA